MRREFGTLKIVEFTPEIIEQINIGLKEGYRISIGTSKDRCVPVNITDDAIKSFNREANANKLEPIRYWETPKFLILQSRIYAQLAEALGVKPEKIADDSLIVEPDVVNFPPNIVEIARRDINQYKTRGEAEREAEEHEIDTLAEDPRWRGERTFEISTPEFSYGDLVSAGVLGPTNVYDEMLRDYDFEKAHRLTSKRTEAGALHDAKRNRRIIELLTDGLLPSEISPILTREGFKKVSQDAIENQIKKMEENYKSHKFLIHNPIDSRLERPDPASDTEAQYINTLESLDKALVLPERAQSLSKMLSKFVRPGLSAVHYKQSDYIDRMAYCAMIVYGKAGYLHPQVASAADMNVEALRPLFGSSNTSNQWVTNFCGSSVKVEGKVA